MFLGACVPADPGTSDDNPGDTASDSDLAWWTDPPGDADDDGYTEADGDCDDGRADVNPGVTLDTCDGVDSDCDDEVDEDFDLDVHEPNDDLPVAVGSLVNEGQMQVYGYLFDTSDVDRFEIEVEEDTFGWFSVEVWLYGTPENAVYEVELYYTEGGTPVLLGSDQATGRGSLGFIDFGGNFGVDDSGSYEVVVRAVEGSGCAAPYTVHVLLGSF